MIDAKQAAKQLGVTAKRVSALASQGRIQGAQKFAGVWTFPENLVVTPGTRGPRPARAEKSNV
jgi:hypothetical protein